MGAFQLNTTSSQYHRGRLRGVTGISNSFGILRLISSVFGRVYGVQHWCRECPVARSRFEHPVLVQEVFGSTELTSVDPTGERQNKKLEKHQLRCTYGLVL